MTNWFTELQKKLNAAAGTLDSLDTVEFIMAVEEVFDVVFPDVAERLRTPRLLIEWLCNEVGRTPPNKRAAQLLRNIAVAEKKPELADSLTEWRRPQIAAVVKRLIQDYTGARSFNEDSSFVDDIFSG